MARRSAVNGRRANRAGSPTNAEQTTRHDTIREALSQARDMIRWGQSGRDRRQTRAETRVVKPALEMVARDPRAGSSTETMAPLLCLAGIQDKPGRDHTILALTARGASDEWAANSRVTGYVMTSTSTSKKIFGRIRVNTPHFRRCACAAAGVPLPASLTCLTHACLCITESLTRRKSFASLELSHVWTCSVAAA